MNLLKKKLRKIEKAASRAASASFKASQRALVTAYTKDVGPATGAKAKAIKDRITVRASSNLLRPISYMRLSSKMFAPFAGISARGKRTGKYRLTVNTKPKKIKLSRGFMIEKGGRKMGFVRTKPGEKGYVFVRYKSVSGDYKLNKLKRKQTIKSTLQGRFRRIYKERFAYYSK